MTEAVTDIEQEEIIEEELPQNPSDEEFAANMENPDQIHEKEDEPDYKAQIADLEDRLLRSAAEMQNIRTRSQKEVEDAGKFGISKFAQDLIIVLENLRRAQDSVKDKNIDENPALKSLSEGIELTANELINAFEKHGIERIDPLGDDFNHDLHQAIAQIPTDEYEVGKIAVVMAAGYKIKDRLLRPAMVGVAAAIPKPKD